jgi:hypothetical protein
MRIVTYDFDMKSIARFRTDSLPWQDTAFSRLLPNSRPPVSRASNGFDAQPNGLSARTPSTPSGLLDLRCLGQESQRCLSTFKK